MVNHKPEDFVAALLGGLIIGLATTLNLLTYGRITGCSGIFNTLVKVHVKEGLKWKYSAFIGLVSAGYLVYISTDKGKWENDSFILYFFDPIEIAIGDLHIVGWIIGGLLVGVGTKMGNGGTSGHGVGGIPRLSIRSITAVGVFMTCGISLATFRHYVPFLESTQSFGDGFEDAWPIVGGSLILVGLLIFVILSITVAVKSNTKAEMFEMPISFLVGFIFGIGLSISGMCRRTKVNNFLTLYDDWDPSLMFVMGGAVGVNLITFPLIIKKMQKPLIAPELGIPKKKNLDAKLIIGAGLFGLGWGLASLGPGPGMVDFFQVTHVLIWIVCLAIGQVGWELTEKIFNRYIENKKESTKSSPEPNSIDNK